MKNKVPSISKPASDFTRLLQLSNKMLVRCLSTFLAAETRSTQKFQHCDDSTLRNRKNLKRRLEAGDDEVEPSGHGSLASNLTSADF